MLTESTVAKRDALWGILEGHFPAPLISAMVERFRRIVPHLDPASDARVVLLWIPGRIEVLGKHTDYAGGVSMTCASSRGMAAVAIAGGPEGIMALDDIAAGVRARIRVDDESMDRHLSWEVYPRAVCTRLHRHFDLPDAGLRIFFESDLPRASGMSSSSALIVMTYLAIAALTPLAASPAFHRQVAGPAQLAAFLGAIESGASFGPFSGDEGTGTRGGSQDHTAILFSSLDTFSVFGYDPVVRLAAIPLPKEWALCVATSGVKARKTGGARAPFNEAVDLARRIAQAWSRERRTQFSTLGHMLEDPELDETRLLEVLDVEAGDAQDRERLWRRYAQFRDECTRVVPEANRALLSGDMTGFAKETVRSVEMAEQWLGNQIPETIYLVDAALAAGAASASPFGAGFGGAVWALAPREGAAGFLQQWQARYAARFPEKAASSHFFIDRASCPATVIGADPVRLQLTPIPVLETTPEKASV